MNVYEPTTSITDLMLAVSSIFLAVRLWRRAETQRSRREWAAALFTCGIAALLGAVIHGLGPRMSPDDGQLLWRATALALGIVSYLLLVAALRSSISNPRTLALAIGAASIKLAAYALWMRSHDDFIYVIIDQGLAMLIVAVLQLRDFRRAPHRAKLMLAGIAVSIAGATVQASGLALHRHFNHNDLYHVLQIGAVYLLYRGGSLFVDAAREA